MKKTLLILGALAILGVVGYASYLLAKPTTKPENRPRISISAPARTSGFTNILVTASSDKFTPINKMVIYSPQKYGLGVFYSDSFNVSGNAWTLGFDTVGLNNGTNKLVIDAFNCSGLKNNNVCVKIASNTFTMEVQNAPAMDPYVKITAPYDGTLVINDGKTKTINISVATKNFDLRYPPKVSLEIVESPAMGDGGANLPVKCTFNGIRSMTHSCRLNLTLDSRGKPVDRTYKIKALAQNGYNNDFKLVGKKINNNLYIMESNEISLKVKTPIIATITSTGATMGTPRIKTMKANISGPSSLSGETFFVVVNLFDDNFGNMGISDRVRDVGYYNSIPCKLTNLSRDGKSGKLTCDYKVADFESGSYTATINNTNAEVMTTVPMVFNVR